MLCQKIIETLEARYPGSCAMDWLSLIHIFKELMFDTGDDILIPDEKTLGRILQEQDLDTKLMIAVGSGVINDSVKFVTSRTGLPYICLLYTSRCV